MSAHWSSAFSPIASTTPAVIDRALGKDGLKPTCPRSTCGPPRRDRHRQEPNSFRRQDEAHRPCAAARRSNAYAGQVVPLADRQDRGGDRADRPGHDQVEHGEHARPRQARRLRPRLPRTGSTTTRARSAGLRLARPAAGRRDHPRGEGLPRPDRPFDPLQRRPPGRHRRLPRRGSIRPRTNGFSQRSASSSTARGAPLRPADRRPPARGRLVQVSPGDRARRPGAVGPVDQQPDSRLRGSSSSAGGEATSRQVDRG